MNEPRKAKFYRNTRLPQETIDEILRLWKTDRYSLDTIGKKFGVSRTLVSLIVRGKKVKL